MLYYKELFFFSTFRVYYSKIPLIRQLNSTPGPCHCHHGYIIFFFDQIISLAHISSHTTLRPLNILFVFQLLTSLTCPTRVYLGELLIHCFSHLILTHSLTRSVASRGHFVGGRPGDHHAALAATATAAASTSAVVTPHCEQNWF